MKTLALAVCISLIACDTTRDVPRPASSAQATLDALDALDTAIRTEDIGALRALWMPERITDFGKTAADQNQGMLAWIRTQKSGYLMAYGDGVPHVTSIADEGSGSLIVQTSSTVPSALKLKELFFYRDTSGRVFYAGRYPTHLPPAEVAASGAAPAWFYGSWAMQNNASINHHFTSGWWDGLRADYMGQIPWNFFSGCSPVCPTCWCNSNINPMNGPPYNLYDIACGPNRQSAFNMYDNRQPGTDSVALMTPNDGAGSCKCANGHASTTPSCCYYNNFSQDFWWNSGDNIQNSLPFCHTGTCPNGN